MFKNVFSPWTIVIIIAIISGTLMLSLAASDSAIVDELAHIPAGYSYVKYQDYRLNPEHPPLVKMIAGFPLLFQHLNFPTDKSSWTTDLNGQWDAGAQFLYEEGNNADQILYWARLGPIFLTILLIFFTYIFAREIIGRWWALLPTLFIGLSPNILAHGHYVTTDIGAALGMLFSVYWFLKYLFESSRKNLILAGVAFGLAQLLKFSAVLLVPYFFLVLIAFALVKNNFWKKLLATIGIGLIGMLVIYAVYLFTVWNYPAQRQLMDTTITLGSFGFRPLANLDIWMAGNKVFRPLAQYLLGVLMVIRRSAGGNTGYFLGEISSAGHWQYFPAVFAMKEPLAILIIILLAFILSILDIFRSFQRGLKSAYWKFREYLNTHFTEFAMIVFVGVYWAYSMHSNLNIGFRHLIPSLPFIYILSASAIRKWFALKPELLPANLLEKVMNLLRRFFGIAVKSIILSVLIIWFLAGAIMSYPNYLSYFNELFGGTKGGYQYVTDSNYDWGQDLKRLKIWADKNLSSGEKIAVDYFGGGSPKYYLGDRAASWSSADNNPKSSGISWLAVSINTIQSATAKTAPGFSRNPIDEYRWLENPLLPYAKAGTSIFIYKL